MSTTFREVDETVERDLFARRARALGEAGGIPSLESVLRAANESVAVARELPQEPLPVRESRESVAATRRRWTGLALAAASIVAVMRTLPHAGPPALISADVRGGSASSPAGPVATCDEGEENACTLDRSYAPPWSSTEPDAPVPAVSRVVSDDRSCEEPIATYVSPPTSTTLSCDRDEAVRSQMP